MCGTRRNRSLMEIGWLRAVFGRGMYFDLDLLKCRLASFNRLYTRMSVLLGRLGLLNRSARILLLV